jgi:hypothetical protein
MVEVAGVGRWVSQRDSKDTWKLMRFGGMEPKLKGPIVAP